jgi:hypothetical protein
MIEGFYQEHLHIDEEIRYIIDGEGYEDVHISADRVLTCRFEISRSDGFDVISQREILLSCPQGYIIGLLRPRAIMCTQLDCSRNYLSGKRIIEKSTGINCPRGRRI